VSAVEQLSLDQRIDGLQRVIEERDRRHGEEIAKLTDAVAPLYALLGQLFEGIQVVGEGQQRLEAEVIFRRQLEARRQRFKERKFDVAVAVAVLDPLRDSRRAVDRRYVSKTFSELGRKPAGAQTKGTTLTKLIRAMGLDPVDVDGDLQAAEVAR
jgi:hypothetical protein